MVWDKKFVDAIELFSGFFSKRRNRKVLEMAPDPGSNFVQSAAPLVKLSE